MGGPWGHYAEWNKLDKDTVWSHLYVQFKIKQKKAHGRREQIGDRQMCVYVCVCVGGWQIAKGGQKVQTFSFKINESWGGNVQHSDCG